MRIVKCANLRKKKRYIFIIFIMISIQFYVMMLDSVFISIVKVKIFQSMLIKIFDYISILTINAFTYILYTIY